MPETAWIALVAATVTVLVNVVIVVRFVSRLEGRLELNTERIRGLLERVKSMERAIAGGRVVILSGPKRRSRPADESGDGDDEESEAS